MRSRKVAMISTSRGRFVDRSALRRAENIAPRAGRPGAKRAMPVGRFMSS